MYILNIFFFFKQKTAYEMRISDWSSDVCSSDLAKSGDAPQGTVTPEKLLALRDIGSRYPARGRDLFSISPDMRFVAFQLHQPDPGQNAYFVALVVVELVPGATPRILDVGGTLLLDGLPTYRSVEHTSQLHSLMRTSFSVF